jgi:transcriptional regulator of heat shock response
LAAVDLDNPKPIELTNIDELADILKDATHRCTSQELLTEIRIGVAEMNRDMISMTACFQQLNARFEEHMREQDQVHREQMQIIASHAADLVDVKHNCRFPDKWKDIEERVKVLEKSEHSRGGASVWTDRAFNFMNSVLVAVVIFVILFFMKGGEMF